jgi:hypothetical protein
LAAGRQRRRIPVRRLCQKGGGWTGAKKRSDGAKNAEGGKKGTRAERGEEGGGKEREERKGAQV